MERFLEAPNLPQGRVTSVIIGSEYPLISDAIRNLGIQAIELPVNSDIPAPVRSHADMSAYYCGSGELILSGSIYPKCCISDFPSGIKLRRAAAEQTKTYPHDISLNACEIGNNIICRRASTDPVILEYAESRGKRIIYSRQGYAKCSVCVLDEQHIITADSSIAAAVSSAGIDALLIEPGFFRLHGYDYGFIGGSCFKISRDMIAFTGSLDGHSDKGKILEYIEKNGLNTVFLTDAPCLDVGSVIQITEEG